MVLGAVDIFQGRGHRLAVFVGYEVQRVPQQVHDAGLHRGFGEHGSDRLWKALQPVDDGDQDVLGGECQEFRVRGPVH